MDAEKSPSEIIRDAIVYGVSELNDELPTEQRLIRLALAILQALDDNDIAVISSDALYDFDDRLNEWLNQDNDQHRLSTFEPLSTWQEVLKLLPTRA